MSISIDKSNGRVSVISIKGLFIREYGVWREGTFDPNDLQKNFSRVQDGEADRLLKEALNFISKSLKIKNGSRLRQQARQNMHLFLFKETCDVENDLVQRADRTKEELQAMEERFYRQ